MDSTYLVKENGSDITFAVITTKSNKTICKKVSQAVKDEFCYVSVSTELIKDSSHVVTLKCECVDVDGENEVKDIELSLTALY
jgi:hypothetical protein